jgi:Predicted archaeal kinase (sugar kinase superfamily)
MTTEHRARAFVPGHLSGFFSTHRTDDPAETGSTGAGVALAEGVDVFVEPGDGVSLNGEATTIGAVSRVLDALGVDGAVRIETTLPVGAGFGVSGAAALGTALAGNRAFDCRQTVNELVTVAHSADVNAETGLGDVVAQARGGASISIHPGAPPHGRADAIPATGRIEYLSRGTLSTRDVLSGDTQTLSAAGDAALDRLVDDPRMETLMSVSRTFARESGLITPEVQELVDEVTAAGGTGAMVMLGQTVFATGTGLTDAGYDPAVTQIHHGGAHLGAE